MMFKLSSFTVLTAGPRVSAVPRSMGRFVYLPTVCPEAPLVSICTLSLPSLHLMKGRQIISHHETQFIDILLHAPIPPPRFLGRR